MQLAFNLHNYVVCALYGVVSEAISVGVTCQGRLRQLTWLRLP